MMGRPSPRKDPDTRKAEQVSWLAAWLTLCAFPSLDKLGTVARADFNAAHSCGAAMDSPSARAGAGGETTIFPRGSRHRDHSASPIQLSWLVLLSPNESSHRNGGS